MSISGTLANALSGLTAASRAAELVSNNVSNALTEGYGKRELQLSSKVLGGSGAGVQIDGVLRHTDPVLTGSRRLAEAALAQAETETDFLNAIEGAIGTPEKPGSLSARVAGLESSLIEAASRPDSDSRLMATVQSAKHVAGHMNALSDRVQSERMEADASIGRAVERINTTLEQVTGLNMQIVRSRSSGHDPSALMDQRQALIDDIAELVPVREVPRQNGTIALFTPGGAILLDGKPAEIGFSRTGLITADMTLGSGALSGLTINGREVSTNPENGPIAGGKLAGLFAVRDFRAPEVQSRLDAVARDLVQRFADPSVDPTLAPGDPGLFTDAGAPFTASAETGLAGRLKVNALVDPDDGGALWKLRDGLGATAPGDPGDARRILALADAMGEPRVPASGGFSAIPRSMSALASDLLSSVSVAAADGDAEASYRRAEAQTLISQEMRQGVDTDEEMQKLLLIEQAFAANARVVATVDDMMKTLLGL